jgi:hypothetical protein
VHADVARPGDVRAAEIPDMDGFRRPDSQFGEGFGKDLITGLGDADLVGETQNFEEVEQPFTPEKSSHHPAGR